MGDKTGFVRPGHIQCILLFFFVFFCQKLVMPYVLVEALPQVLHGQYSTKRVGEKQNSTRRKE